MSGHSPWRKIKHEGDRPRPDDQRSQSAPGLTISGWSLDGICRLTLAGELDVASAPELNVAIDDAMSDRPTELILDLAAVTFVDSSGLGVFVWAKRSRGLEVVLHRPSEQFRQLLELTKLDEEFEITE